MEQYYKSYYLKKCNEVDFGFVKEKGFVLKAFIPCQLGIRVGEMMNDKMEISFVVYYTELNTKKIMEYHEVNYGMNILLGVCEELLAGTKICFHKNGEVVKHSIETYHDDGRPNILQEFNKNFELVEYRHSIYDGSGNHIMEKIFFADSWTTHTEKMIL